MQKRVVKLRNLEVVAEAQGMSSCGGSAAKMTGPSSHRMCRQAETHGNRGKRHVRCTPASSKKKVDNIDLASGNA